MLGQLGNRVLLVDDEPLVRKVVSGCLVAAGYVVQTAVDGLEALGKLRAGLPDLIISDLSMPRMSGYELLRVVHKRFPQIPVMVLSADAPGEMPEGVAADAYYDKSGIGFQQFLATVEEVARKSPLRPAPPPVDNKPVQARWDGNGHYTVGCADCLREFTVPRIFQMSRDEKWATCVHCGKVVQFFVAEHSEAK